MLEILFFAFISGWLVYKLYKIFGDPNYDPSSETINKLRNQAKMLETIELKKKEDIREKQIEEEVSFKEKYGLTLYTKIQEVKKILPNFSPIEFSNGALYAFEQIIKAFSNHDKKLLKGLLDDKLFALLEKEIDKNISDKIYKDVTIISIVENNIVDINFDKKDSVEILVKIVSDQVRLTKDLNGIVIEGKPSQINRISDLWTFSCNTSSDKNWLLVKINHS